MRPRSTGEILDDAWRLSLADAPLLLLFAALFLIPAFIALLLLLAGPAPTGIAQVILPALAALLLPLTGLASGSCQELFRRRAADEPVSARVCLRAALRHGLEHAAARAVLLVGIVLGLLFLLLPGLILWASSTSVHALLAAGKGRTGTLFAELRRDIAFAPLKAVAVTLSRLALLLLLVVQLHLLAHTVLWVLENLAGFDMALLGVEWSFVGNPVYTLALFLLGWLLLTPFFEAGNFLLHTDVRTRQEGLDLQYRVQRVFSGLSRIGAALVLASLLLAGSLARAEEGQREVVRSVRIGVETIRDEVKQAEPYPGGQRWVGRLRDLGARLMRAGEGRRYRWYDQALTDFGERNRDDALIVLDELHRRLSLLEDTLAPPRRDAASGEAGEQPRRSPEEVKSLLRGSPGRKRDSTRPREKVKEEREEPPRDEIRRDEPGEGGRRVRSGGGGPQVSVPGGGGGFSTLGWVLLVGLALAILAVAGYLFFTRRREARAPKTQTATGRESVPDGETRQVLEESPAELWRQAEHCAGEGRFRDAVRGLYLAVLALLHRQRLIRFEPTRTNGEYVCQVQLAEQAPPALHAPFEQLTNLFEAQWYGERPCESGDYRASRTLAEEIQQLVSS
jgi:hypothetical protein